MHKSFGKRIQSILGVALAAALLLTTVLQAQNNLVGENVATVQAQTQTHGIGTGKFCLPNTIQPGATLTCFISFTNLDDFLDNLVIDRGL